jgi:hypothetical protein
MAACVRVLIVYMYVRALAIHILKMEELAGSLEVARNQRDDLEGDKQGQKCIDSE